MRAPRFLVRYWCQPGSHVFVNPSGTKLMQLGHLQCSACGKEDRPGITCLVCPEVGVRRYMLVNEDLGKFVEGHPRFAAVSLLVRLQEQPDQCADFEALVLHQASWLQGLPPTHGAGAARTVPGAKVAAAGCRLAAEVPAVVKPTSAAVVAGVCGSAAAVAAARTTGVRDRAGLRLKAVAAVHGPVASRLERHRCRLATGRTRNRRGPGLWLEAVTAVDRAVSLWLEGYGGRLATGRT